MSKLPNSRTLVPKEFIDELLNRTNLVELIDGYVPLKKNGNNYVACCPFHNEKTPSFNVVAKKQFYHCFGCASSGNAISFVMNYLNQGFTDALQTLAARCGMQLPRDNCSEKIEQVTNLYQLLESVNQFYQQSLKEFGISAINYLCDRGLNNAVIQRFQLGFAKPGWNNLEIQFRSNKADLIKTGMLVQKEDGKTYDRYRHRIMFPIHDRHGRIIGFGGRVISNEEKPKYLNSPETIIFQKNRELYGLYHVLQETASPDYILIVEGYLDVIALIQHGIKNAVATLGTATSTYHIQLLCKYTKQLIFCFDGDTAGKQAAWRALESSLPHLDSGLDVRFTFIPDEHDPDSLVRTEGKNAFMSRLAQAIPLSQYFLDMLTKDLDMQSVAGKSQLINAAKPYLLAIPEGSYKQLLINELSRLTRIDNHHIMQIIAAQMTGYSNLNSSVAPSIINKQASRYSPIQKAIALLVQHPELYTACPPDYQQQITVDSLNGLNDKGQEILSKLLKQIIENPSINTAALVEFWRDTPAIFHSLGKLVGWEHNLPDEALTKEFVDIILFLKKKNLKNKINQYLEKSKKQGLTVAEKVILQNLLKEQHQIV